MNKASIFDGTLCELGEGPLWHPQRQQLYWFDINAWRLHSTDESRRTQTWQFDEYVSAGGWVNEEQILLASETGLFLFDLSTGTQELVSPIEANNPVTRSNDCRADPHGGFWFGTMGKSKQRAAGAIWRYYRGETRLLYPRITIANAICFSPFGETAYFADTPTGKVWRQALGPKGWPVGDAEVFLNLPSDSYRPDGAVVDTQGDLWIAQYGYGKVVRFGPDGREKQAITIPGKCTTCPAFGGPDYRTLFVTTARQNLSNPSPLDGQTYSVAVDVDGQPEHMVIL